MVLAYEKGNGYAFFALGLNSGDGGEFGKDRNERNEQGNGCVPNRGDRYEWKPREISCGTIDGNACGTTDGNVCGTTDGNVCGTTG